MANDPERDRELAELEAASERYVAFCGVVCFVAFFLLGWPALIAWVGLAWAMNGFVQAMRDSHRRRKPRSRSPHTHKPHRNRRCCD